VSEDVFLALTRDGAVPTDFPALEQRAYAETFRLLEGAGLEAGKPARRLMGGLLTEIILRDPVLLDVYPVSPEDAVRIAFGRIMRFVKRGLVAPPEPGTGPGDPVGAT